MNTALTLTAADYGLYTLLGICVVFFALILLMVIIKVLVKVTDEKPKAVAAAAGAGEPAAVVAVPDAPKAPGSAGEFKLYDTDPRDAAMVMAIIADELGKPLNELRFISIREVK